MRSAVSILHGAARPRDFQSTAAISAFTLISAALLASPASAMLRVLFPAAAIVVALFLYFRAKPAFVSFTLWLWFLTPFVRRVIDFRAGYSPQSLILATPELAASICVLSVLRRPGALGTRQGFPFLCAIGAVLYATVIGAVRYSPFEVGRAFVSWMLPIMFGLFLYIEREHLPEFRASFEKTFLYGSLVMGSYGIIQFFYLPGWDQYWMLNVDMGPFGLADAQAVRVFSTANAPVILASLLMCGLIFMTALKGKVRILAAGVALAALLLTLSRSGWLGFACALAYLIFRLQARDRLRIATVVFCGLAAAVALMQLPAVHDLLAGRFNTMADVQHDASFQARVEGHVAAFQDLLDKPYGEGLGSMESKEHATYSNDESIGPHDSTILEILYSLGWFGGGVYLLGVLLLCGALFLNRSGVAAYPGAAVVVGILSQSLLNSVVSGVWGLLLWSSAVLCIAAREEESPAIVPAVQLDAFLPTMRPVPGAGR